MTFIEKLKIKIGLLKYCEYCRHYSHDPELESCEICEKHFKLLGSGFKLKLATTKDDLQWFERKGSENPIKPR